MGARAGPSKLLWERGLILVDFYGDGGGVGERGAGGDRVLITERCSGLNITSLYILVITLYPGNHFESWSRHQFVTGGGCEKCLSICRSQTLSSSHKTLLWIKALNRLKE